MGLMKRFYGSGKKPSGVYREIGGGEFIKRQEAAGGVSIEIEGLDELYEKLQLLEAKVARAAVRKGLRAAAKLVFAEAKLRCPVISGDLKASLKIRAFKGRDRSAFGVSIQTAEGWFKGDEFYGAFVEFGTSHAPAHPFLRTAFDLKAREASHVACETIAAEIEKHATATFAGGSWGF